VALGERLRDGRQLVADRRGRRLAHGAAARDAVRRPPETVSTSCPGDDGAEGVVTSSPTSPLSCASKRHERASDATDGWPPPRALQLTPLWIWRSSRDDVRCQLTS
jgi:hypothetical protein